IVDGEEGAARVAELNILPVSGPVDPDQYIANSVDIYYLSAGSEFLLFHGEVELPTYDIGTGLLSLVCTDAFQSFIDRTTLDQALALTGGKWHKSVFGEPDSNAQY
ncbi:hypothetical protein, partial [Halomonas marinisediminis]